MCRYDVAVSLSSPSTAHPSATPELLSIVLPAYNEQEVLPMAYERFTAVRPALAELGLDYELVFVNDGSRDDTPAMLDDLAASDPHVRAVHLTRNFGHQAAITAGLNVARGDAVVIMDCDLQDPPEILPDFVRKWREGYQVVFAVRQKRKESIFKKTAYWTFYRLMALTAEGRALLKEAMPLWEVAQAEAAATLGKEWAALAERLSRIGG